jgi:hypothetical protein
LALTALLNDLDDANAAKADFLAAADGDDDATTSLNETQVNGSVTTAVQSVDDAVVAAAAADATDDLTYIQDDYKGASTAVKTAIVNDTQAALADILATEQEDLTEAQTAVADITGLGAAVASLKVAQDAVADADKAETLAGNEVNSTQTDFATLSSGTVSTAGTVAAEDAVVSIDLSTDSPDAGAITVVEYDADAEAYVLATDVTEADYEGVTAVRDALNAQLAAAATSDTADSALLNAQLQVNYLDRTAAAQTDLEEIAAAFAVTQLGTDELPELAEIQTELAILEGLNSALKTAIGEVDTTVTDKGAAELSGLLDTAIDNGAIAESDKTAITSAADLDNAPALSAAEAAVDNNSNLAVLQPLVDDFIDFNDPEAAQTSTTNDTVEKLITSETAVEEVEALISDLDEALADQAEGQASVDALIALNAAIDDAETAFDDAGFAAPVTIDADNEYATSGDDIFVVGTIADNTSIVLNFGLLGDDQLFLGSDVVQNTGAIATDGDNSVLEFFLTEVGGSATITLEQDVFGSNSSDAETVITLSGVGADEVTFADGFLSIA